MKGYRVSRRDFLSLASKSWLIVLADTVVTRHRAFGFSQKSAVPAPITLDLSDSRYSSLATVGASLNIPDPNNSTRPIIVRRVSQTAVAAVSSQCTYDGCQLPLSGNGVYTCPCCGSQFDQYGNVLRGPASQPLTAYTAQLNAGVITISFGTAVGFAPEDAGTSDRVTIAVVGRHLRVDVPRNSETATIILSDARGALVRSALSFGGNAAYLNVEGLARGIYAVSIRCGQRAILSQRILI
jgi:Rieske Fe-S protein